MKRVTQADIARRVNLSQAAIAVALDDSATSSNIRISAATRRRVQAVARELRYVPHHAARSLKSGKTHTIVLATLMSLKYAYVHSLCEQIAWALTPLGYHLDLELLAPTKDPAAVYRTYLAGRCDGVISSNVIEPFFPELRALRRHGLPVVTVATAPSRELTNVYFDFAVEAEIGTRHLLDQGFRDIAFVVTATDDVAQRAWRRGYERALAAAGIALNPSYLVPWQAADDPRPLWEKIAALQPRPTGILVYNAELTARLSRVIQLAGVRIPDEVGLVSCGDAELHECLNVPLTAVAVDHREMALAMVERLMAQINNPAAPPQHIWVKPHLVVRESSRKRETQENEATEKESR